MELKTIEDKREFLHRNLDKINMVVTAMIGANVRFEIIERQTPWETYVKLEDNHNFASLCGVMKRAWKNVRIETFNIWWTGDRAELVMQFRYEHIDGGHNGAEFGRLIVMDDLVVIK